MPVNIEIKAHCGEPEEARKILLSLNADHKGQDQQVDTYFKVSEGRLKLREGRIENNLILYKRSDQAGPKKSEVLLYPGNKDPELKEILNKVLGTLVVVDKIRDIYFIDNVKFHIDTVKGLGDFLEIEAIGKSGAEESLEKQCKHYMDILNIRDSDLISVSYSDLILKNKGI